MSADCFLSHPRNTHSQSLTIFSSCKIPQSGKGSSLLDQVKDFSHKTSRICRKLCLCMWQVFTIGIRFEGTQGTRTSWGCADVVLVIVVSLRECTAPCVSESTSPGQTSMLLGHSVCPSLDHNLNVIWYHLTSLPGPGERNSGFQKEGGGFWS